MKKSFCLMLMCTAVSCAKPVPVQTKPVSAIPPIEALHVDFGDFGGCVMIEDKSKRRWQTDGAACQVARSPCSTFKVPHAMIGLQTGILRADEVVPWDGVKRFYASWNAEQTLKTAITFSTVWFFKRLARLIGAAKMKHHLQEMSYGNQNISAGLDSFWLSSSLVITPAGQLEFLHAMTQHQVPSIDPKHSKMVWSLLSPKRLSSGAIVRGKTGSCHQRHGSHGWFVGTIEHQNKQMVFATVITQPSKRVLLGNAAKRLAWRTINQWALKQQ